jgi:uncharacterized protein YjiS (DUF1127 family)
MKKLIKKVQRAISAHNRYLTNKYELSRLSDRALADLGIHRGDIEFIARKYSKKEVA